MWLLLEALLFLVTVSDYENVPEDKGQTVLTTVNAKHIPHFLKITLTLAAVTATLSQVCQ